MRIGVRERSCICLGYKGGGGIVYIILLESDCNENDIMTICELSTILSVHGNFKAGSMPFNHIWSFCMWLVNTDVHNELYVRHVKYLIASFYPYMAECVSE